MTADPGTAEPSEVRHGAYLERRGEVAWLILRDYERTMREGVDTPGFMSTPLAAAQPRAFPDRLPVDDNHPSRR